MLSFILSLTTAIIASEPLPDATGTIQGVVVNGTHGNQPLEDVAVVLRAGMDGQLVAVAETKTDQFGKFAFEQVPLEPAIVYLPGANRDGIHYPGQRVRLDSRGPLAQVKIVTFDTVTAPCPLVAKRHEIEVTVEERALKITEVLLISNPARATYVGQSMGNGPPVTHWLSIPKNFDRVTFEKEFFGRRFLVVDHRPVTDIPWLPGEQELRFTYHVPLAESAGQFRRELDVPTSAVRVRVRGANQRQVLCSLPQSEANDEELVFAEMSEQLASGFTIELQITSLPFPWAQYARWGSVIVLALLAGVTVAIPRVRRRRTNPPPRAHRRRAA